MNGRLYDPFLGRRSECACTSMMMREVRMAVPIQITIDCADPARLARFWALALDYVEPPPPEGYRTWHDWILAQGWPEEEWNSANAIQDPEGVGARIYFQRVPEPKMVKNRVHLDVNVGGGKKVPLEERRQRIDANAEQLINEGARVQRIHDQPEREPDYYGIVMQDPEGNEFCLQ